jgi:hypothetical protein
MGKAPAVLDISVELAARAVKAERSEAALLHDTETVGDRLTMSLNFTQQ